MSDTSANIQYSLYYYDSCPFCVRVLRALNSIDIDVEYRDVLSDSNHRSELHQATGRTTVPCLRIDNGSKSQWMFESMDIIRFLQTL
jgi:glutaredoxin 2